MSLSLFLCIRWGHAESPEGADGEETSFLVRAHDHAEAAALADEILRWMPTHIEGNPRVVEARCHRVLLLGVDISWPSPPGVIMGPAIGYALRSDSQSYKMWCRGEPGQSPDEWIPESDIYGGSAESHQT